MVTNPGGQRATPFGESNRSTTLARGFTYDPRLRAPPTLTVSGTVLGFRETGQWVPVPNLRLKVLASSRYDGAVDGIALPDTVTDAHGRYTPGMWFIGWTGAWGTVSEQIDGSLHPVAGATVILDDSRPDPPATTGPNGFYMICSLVGEDQGPRTLVAFKTGYNPVQRDYTDGSGIHLQLTRK